VHVDVVIALLEAQAGSFLILRPTDRRAGTQLRAVGVAVRSLAARLNELGEDASDAALERLSHQGYDSTFIGRLREGLELLEQATDLADSDLLPQRQSGRPPASVRAWLARQVRITLQDDGLDAHSREGARTLSACLRLVLSAVGEPVPDDMRPLLNEARLA
jgi:hypothetical protein